MSHYKPTVHLTEIRHLIAKLNHGNKQERCEAAKQLHVLASKGVPSARQALPALIVALDDRSWAVRDHAMGALAMFPSTPEIDRALARAVRLQATASKRTARDSSAIDARTTNTPTKDNPKPQDKATSNAGPEPAAVSNLTDQANQFVMAVAPKCETVLAFLSSAGFDTSELNKLTSEEIAQLSSAVAACWCEQLPSLLDLRTADIIIRHRGLNGESHSTLQELGDYYGVTRERIRQLEIKGIQRLKQPHKRRALVMSAVTTAGAVLGASLMPLPEQHIAAPESEMPAPIPAMDTTTEPPHAKSYLAQSLLETHKLVSQGMSPNEIMQARGVTDKTVYKHLVLLIEQGQICVEQVLPAEIISQIQQAIGKRRRIASLATLKQRLPATLSYGEIRCVIAARLNEAKHRRSS